MRLAVKLQTAELEKIMNNQNLTHCFVWKTEQTMKNTQGREER
jgi:hypothetical protein